MSALEDVEVDLFLEAIFRHYGYDFRRYARASLKRRVRHRMQLLGLEHVSDLIPRVLHDRAVFDQFLEDMSISVTEMFRDPPFFRAVRETIIPILKTYPFVRIWHAGCATGEEVYSMAILLHEADFLDRAQIYATDCNKRALKHARDAIYPVSRIREFTRNYNETGAGGCFSDYYTARGGSAKLKRFLRENVTFSFHNLVTDGVFGEMNLIICRNVLIYFQRELQNRALGVFRDSLTHRGFLCLGTKETIAHTDAERGFETVNGPYRLYRKAGRRGRRTSGAWSATP